MAVQHYKGYRLNKPDYMSSVQQPHMYPNMNKRIFNSEKVRYSSFQKEHNYATIFVASAKYSPFQFSSKSIESDYF